MPRRVMTVSFSLKSPLFCLHDWMFQNDDTTVATPDSETSRCGQLMLQVRVRRKIRYKKSNLTMSLQYRKKKPALNVML